MKTKVLTTVLICISSMIGGGIVEAFRGNPVLAGDVPAKPTDEIVARIFRLIDKEGRTRALLSTSRDSNPLLSLWSDDQKMRLVLKADSDGGSVSLFSGNEEREGAVLAAATGAGALKLMGTTNKEYAALCCRPDGNPFLLLNKNNKGSAYLEAQETLSRFTLSHEGRDEFVAAVTDKASALTVGSDNAHVTLAKESDTVGVLIEKQGKVTWSTPEK